MERKRLLTMREAAQAASKALMELYPNHPLHNLRVEEVESVQGSKHGKEWSVTMGFDWDHALAKGTLTLRSQERQYKKLFLNARTGSVRSVRIHRVQ